MKIGSVVLVSLMFGINCFASREVRSTTLDARMRSKHPAPKWLGGSMAGGGCSFEVRLNNLSNLEQHAKISFEDLKSGFGMYFLQTPMGTSNWTNAPAAGTSGWLTLSSNYNNIIRDVVLPANGRISEHVSLKCAAKKNASSACAVEPATNPAPDIGAANAWSTGSVECDKADVVCGGDVSFGVAVKVAVTEDRGAVTGRVIGTCTLNSGADHLVLESAEQQLNAGRPF